MVTYTSLSQDKTVKHEVNAWLSASKDRKFRHFLWNPFLTQKRITLLTNLLQKSSQKKLQAHALESSAEHSSPKQALVKLFPGKSDKLTRIAIPIKKVSENPSAVAKAILPESDKLTTMYIEIDKSWQIFEMVLFFKTCYIGLL